jgi:hypothetical protein
MASSALINGVRLTLPESGYVRLSDGTLLNVPSTGGGSTALTGDNSNQANTSSAASIVQTHVTTGANSSQANSSSAAAISQSHVTTGANSSQSNASTIGEINQTYILDGVGSDQENNLSTAGIIQQHTQHTLIGINSVQNNQSSTAGIISPTADTESLVISNKQILAIANRETITGVSNKSFNSEADLCLH